VNASGKPRHPGLHAAIARAGRHEWLRNAVKAVVPFGVREAIRSKNLQPSEVPPEIAHELGPRFADDIADLEDALGRPVPASWRRP